MSANDLSTIRTLIERQHYTAARRELRKLPHDPKARRWLAQLDARHPSNSGHTWRTVFFALLISVIILVGVIAVQLHNSAEYAARNVRQAYCTAQYDRYTDQWRNCIESR